MYLSTDVQVNRILVVEDRQGHRDILQQVISSFFDGIHLDFAFTASDLKNYLFHDLGEYDAILVDVNLDEVTELNTEPEVPAKDGIDFVNLLVDRNKILDNHQIVVYSAWAIGAGAQQRLRPELSNRAILVEKTAIFQADLLKTYKFFYPILNRIRQQVFSVRYAFDEHEADQLPYPVLKRCIRVMFPERLFTPKAIGFERTLDDQSFNVDIGKNDLLMSRRLVIETNKKPKTEKELQIGVYGNLAKTVVFFDSEFHIETFQEIIKTLQQTTNTSAFRKCLLLYLAQRNLTELYLNKAISLDEVDIALRNCGDYRILFQHMVIKRLVTKNPQKLNELLTEMGKFASFLKVVDFYLGMTVSEKDEYTRVHLTSLLKGRTQPVPLDFQTSWLKDNCITGPECYFHYLLYESSMGSCILIEAAENHELDYFPS